jgi:nucleotide-binding universal stress UspA family protein
LTLAVRRATGDADGVETIVVAVDGSDPSQRALEWAAAEARLRHARLRVVHSWFDAFITAYFAAPALYEREAIERAGQELLDRTVASIPAGSPEIEIEPVLAHGQPATVLLDEAERASLIVVGSRGRSGLSGFVLGSVSNQVVHRAACPVVVIR